MRIKEIEKRQKELINMVDTLAEKKSKTFIEINAFNINKRKITKRQTMSNM